MSLNTKSEFTFIFRDGDVYEALRDCQAALLLEPDHVKANFR